MRSHKQREAEADQKALNKLLQGYGIRTPCNNWGDAYKLILQRKRDTTQEGLERRYKEQQTLAGNKKEKVRQGIIKGAGVNIPTYRIGKITNEQTGETKYYEYIQKG